MNDLFGSKSSNSEDGFDAFWKLYPRDPRRPGRKAGKRRCLQIWKRDKLYKNYDHVLKALKEDIAKIPTGIYAIRKDSFDKMATFPGIQPWLNQQRWDRDLSPTKAKTEESEKPKAVEPAPEINIITEKVRREMTPVWRAVAQGRASLIPKKQENKEDREWEI